jgi:hypothetical protein
MSRASTARKRDDRCDFQSPRHRSQFPVSECTPITSVSVSPEMLRGESGSQALEDLILLARFCVAHARARRDLKIAADLRRVTK